MLGKKTRLSVKIALASSPQHQQGLNWFTHPAITPVTTTKGNIGVAISRNAALTPPGNR